MDLFTEPPSNRFPPPREFQSRAIERLRDGIRQGHRKQILVAATGSGKTYIALRIVGDTLNKGRRALFVADRTALINQTSERADAYGLTNHGIVQANHPRRDNSLPFQIASLQTLAARGYWPEADVIIIDECHCVYTAWTEHIKATPAAVIGLTATPCTQGLGLHFGHMVNAATPHELTEAGILVPLDILSCQHPDMKGAETSGGEWTDKAAAERSAKIIGDVVQEWINHGEGRKTIAFGATIAYCEELCRRFNGAGIGAELFTSETLPVERERILKEFQKPESVIRVLLSVDALAKGFDQQDVGCIIDARPLRKSFSTFVQIVGRGLRSSPDTGKVDCKLLDFSGNIVRFKSDFEDMFFNGFKSLDTSTKLDGVARTDDSKDGGGCPQCHYKPFYKRCMSCGFELTREAMIDEAPGEMLPVMLGKKQLANDHADMWAQLCTYARRYVKGKQEGWVWHKFSDLTGHKAPRSWSLDGTPDVAITAATMGKLKAMRIAYHKGRQKRQAELA